MERFNHPALFSIDWNSILHDSSLLPSPPVWKEFVMLGHSSLQRILTRYQAWIPRKTRKDGAAFLDSIAEKEANEDLQGKENEGRERSLVCRNDTNTTHIQEQKNRHPDSNPEASVFVG